MAPAIPFETLAAQAVALGASLIGIAHLPPLLDSPSHRAFTVPQRVREARSIVVVALAHGDGQPQMDWWDNRGGKTPGNRRLIHINRGLASWLRKAYAAEASDLPYQPSRGGIFLKDAAILSGVGVMGKNNLLVTPQYGPRVRLRALLLDLAAEPSGPLDGFAPCDGCPAPCLPACPKNAFQTGSYQIAPCLSQMRENETHRIVLKHPIVGMPDVVKTAYCRLCELACPVGR